MSSELVQRYKHGVIHELMDSALLGNVRSEILDNLHFTPKETDIYKIHQSGDLANLDGLDDSSLSRLPSLLKLRDALYSSTFRKYISEVANSGPLSGKKTDMAINVYTPGCHLLCHDDVIGSRRLSYILYLTDPEKPWRPQWGGALRLYPTQRLKTDDGVEATVPSADFSLSIPPAWNQLSFFAIQPGESFHDVEEVYERKGDEYDEDGKVIDDGGRLRMAISGWFHIPQEGEDGYEEGLEEKLAEKSSLTQLQSKSDHFDLPQPRWRPIEQPGEDGPTWDETELDWLLKYINPTYLVPETIEALSEAFQDSSVVTLADFLHPKFAARLREYITTKDQAADTLIGGLGGAPEDTGVARPPHKHRFLYRHAAAHAPAGSPSATPLDELVDEFFPSQLFARWLSLFSELMLSRGDFLARRFRPGSDYTLATSYDESEPQLELCLGITPTSGWGGDAAGDDDEDEDDEEENGIPAKAPANGSRRESNPEEDAVVGGYEVYMVGDDEDDEDEADETDVAAQGPSSHTGAGPRKKTKADPAVYKASAGDEEDDGVLFTNPASWNTLSIVLRDKGLLRFVKYVSASAKGSRWDVLGNFTVVPEDDDEEDE
jgi:Rps23 Pro-64 3,4-dihydroxylase Tpa1-like proline 4-hydroxylase